MSVKSLCQNLDIFGLVLVNAAAIMRRIHQVQLSAREIVAPINLVQCFAVEFRDNRKTCSSIPQLSISAWNLSP
jgi:hypothetical protein